MMVYDGRRVLLFGGSGETGSLGDLWSRDGVQWRSLEATPGPPPRNSGAMAYDSRRNRSILFGGRNSQGTLADTWEWDGRRWEQLDTAGGPPPVHSVAGFDARSGEVTVPPPPSTTLAMPSAQLAGTGGHVVLFDGETRTTWTWRDGRWTSIAGAGTVATLRPPVGLRPPARARRALRRHEGRERPPLQTRRHLGVGWPRLDLAALTAISPPTFGAIMSRLLEGTPRLTGV